MIEAANDAIDNAGAIALFAILVLLAEVLLLCGALFTLMVVHTAWRWLTRHTWSDVIRSVEHKALR